MEDTLAVGHAAPTHSPNAAEHLVLATISAHADALLRTARRYSMCADDAYDAYQRGIEIFMRRAASLDPDGAPSWLHVVIKNEALAVRRARADVVASDDLDVDRDDVTGGAAHVASPEERVLAADRTTRAAEALQRLKPHELRAMWLKATGKSYQEICAETGWSYTKVNRCLTEGRRSFLERYAGIEAGRECERWQPVLSAIVDGEATAVQLSDARPHLRNCPACRATVRELREVQHGLRALLPIGGLAGAGTAGVGSGGGVDEGAGVVGRLWDTLTGLVHERAATSGVRLQMLLDSASATSATKAAAVAASAAAVASGGTAIVHRAATTETKRHPVARAAPPRAAPAAAKRTSGVTATRPAASAPTPTSATSRRTRITPAARTAAARQRVVRRAAKVAPRATPAAVAGEFVESAAPAASAPGARRAPSAARAAGTTRTYPTAPRNASPQSNGAEFDP
jgi:RNA polymerase sigma factor (sigma-70 family)